MTASEHRQDITLYEAYLFDLDGVITPTVELHRTAWRETFEACFARLADEGAFGTSGTSGAARAAMRPYEEQDYFDSLDGRPRFDAVATLLAARGIALPEGAPGDEGLDTVIGIGNRKNRVFLEVLERDGIAAYPGSILLLDRLTALGKRLAVVSSSRNAEQVLVAAGLRDRFDTVVDGVVASHEGLAGKPAPDTYLRAAALLDARPGRSVVFEDAASGVAAGRAGGFGLVVGVDRGAGADALLRDGADVVVNDLKELL